MAEGSFSPVTWTSTPLLELVAADRDVAVELAVRRVVLEHVLHVVKGDERVADGITWTAWLCGAARMTRRPMRRNR